MKKNLVYEQSEFAISKAVHELIEFYQSSWTEFMNQVH